MSDQDIEILKLQIQRDMQDQASRERSQQANRDFWKWAIMYLIVMVNPTNLVTTVLEHRAIATVDKKADTAAKTAVVLKKTVDGVATDTAGTYAINSEWKAGRTGDPEDMAKAVQAEAKVMAQGRPE